MLNHYVKNGGTILMASHDSVFAEASGTEITPMESLGVTRRAEPKDAAE